MLLKRISPVCPELLFLSHLLLLCIYKQEEQVICMWKGPTRDTCLKHWKVRLMVFQVTFAILHNYFRPNNLSAENAGGLCSRCSLATSENANVLNLK